MRIAVGVVHHGEDGPHPVEETDQLELLSLTNARRGAAPTRWQGFGANHNLLMDGAAGVDWYVALNPDVEVSASQILSLVGHGEDSGFAVVAPLFESPWGVTGGAQSELPGARRWLREAVTGTRSEPRQAYPAAVTPSRWVSGACMAINVARLQIRFDERYFMYFEDVDLCCRASAAGAGVAVCTEILLGHRSGWRRSDPLLARRGIEFARGATRFALQQGGSGNLMRLAGAIRFGSRLLVPGRTEPERAGARAVSSGFVRMTSAEGLAEPASRHNEQIA